ncbi:unnamed protein product [Leptosia nina]|uniref:C2H2-type domain-containing protein n=1 Tax=Leptosia nina TaxID=320188 RepID=A0AAV1J0B0_9NEOP
MSLGDPHISGLPAVATETPTVHLYEEAQAEIMLKKNRIILDTMLSYEKLVHVFKCAGRFCSYTTDSAEDALHHVTTHSRVGGENALKCAYCDFNSLDNAIDLVTHVFKSHGFCQYACCYCFYRAVSSQMVNAHIDRIHATMPIKKVLKTSFTTEPPEDSQMLSREDAVPHYVCNCDEDNSKCKFKTYTPGKLCEHMKSKHPNAEVYECYICQLTSQNVAEIIHHYKTHGLKLYQCARCVFGADSEKELLTHASIYHSIYQPQAYLRVITNKEGTKEYRVLPLAHLNKTNALTIDVPPSSIRDNPVREAERSVDLEKLIGHSATYREPASEPSADGPSEQSPEGRALDTILDFAPEVRPCTPPVPIALEQQTTPIIKQESMIRASTTPQQTSSDIICIDSDEDGLDVSSASNISTTSNVPAEVEIQSKPMTFPLSYLYKCSECGSLSKNAVGFRQHLKGCFENRDIVPCAFCQFKGRKSRIVTHYNKTHQVKLTNNMRHDCGDCGATFMSTEAIKKHHKDEHDATEINIINKVVDKVKIREVTKRVTLRRKSAASIGGEPPAKMKKFGPQDVNLLPINPIFDESIHCSLCEFSTKVRLNMVRHLQLHANQQPVPQTAPVNPVPHLETNEKHFDKMVNLASSSLLTRQDKNIRSEPVVTHMISPDKTSRYPKYVPERTRHTCGAKNCLYISSDESMLKYHWETLHSGSNDFHCVHCPPYQTLDTKTPLTASRIIAHLRMHDVRLYACSRCTFYHYKRQVVERHMNEIHKECKVMTVREEAKEVVPQATAAPAPTMDLKPWQCGLCEFKSLLRPEVSEHCAKLHNSKMQFKCVYCAFRTSNIENVTKHQAKSHQGKPAVTFYFYYREGSIPEPDGLPFWEMQRNKYNLTETKVKTEKATSPTPIAQTTTIQSDAPVVNLNIVKQEAKETSEDSMEELCERFGQFCEPNGLKYKCPLCKQVIEDTKVAMQSHLFEELQYRKWSCSICFYKAFHRQGLTEHMQSEHHQNRDPVELPVDVRVETWVTKLLEHQEAIINLAKEKLDQQKAEIRKNTEPLQQQKVQTQASSPSRNAQDKPNKEELERQFGALGQSKSMSFCCPKCNELIKEECNMRDHLESELNKIRWCCSVCPKTFQSYHQAQFHCKTHLGQSSRPLEAPRDSTLRTAWVDAVLECQKLSMNCETPEKHSESPEPPENSLLVVRYEETVPTPEIQATSNRDSDDERLVIAEQQRGRKRKATLTCDHCPFISSNKKTLTEHLLRHYGLKPYICVYCKLTGPLRSLQKHQKIYHAMKPMKIETTEVPNEPPNEYLRKNKKVQSFAYCVCLTCQSPVMEMDVSDHIHDNIEPEFGRFGEVIVRCSTCNTLHKDIGKFQEHSKIKHPNDGNYVFYKLSHEHRPNQACTLCPQKFSLKKDLRAHIEAMHAKSMEYATIERRLSKDVIVLDDEEDTLAEVTPSPRRKVARKSTTKLPWTKSVARKSTTKLPMNYNEYSFYGTTFSADGLENVTTLMPFYNTVVPVTFQRLSDILNVNPRVVVKKMEKPISEHVNK